MHQQYADEKAYYHRGTGGEPHKLFNSQSINSTVREILQTRMTGEESYMIQIEFWQLIIASNLLMKTCSEKI